MILGVPQGALGVNTVISSLATAHFCQHLCHRYHVALVSVANIFCNTFFVVDCNCSRIIFGNHPPRISSISMMQRQGQQRLRKFENYDFGVSSTMGAAQDIVCCEGPTAITDGSHHAGNCADDGKVVLLFDTNKRVQLHRSFYIRSFWQLFWLDNYVVNLSSLKIVKIWAAFSTAATYITSF